MKKKKIQKDAESHFHSRFLRPHVLLHFHSSHCFFFFLLSSMRKNTAICVTRGLILAYACDLHPRGGRESGRGGVGAGEGG